jgi:hypothetical protein
VHYRPSVDEFLSDRRNEELYEFGHAHGMMSKQAGEPESVHALSGRLYLSQSGWLRR